MTEAWSENELIVATRGYLWMLRAIESGGAPVKAKVRRALVAGTLAKRSEPSIEFRFRNISSVLADMGRSWIKGYLPADNVGQTVEPIIRAAIQEYDRLGRHAKRVPWLVAALPPETVKLAAKQLGSGAVSDYPESTVYDAVLDVGIALAPKSVISTACFLHYGVALKPEDFSGGEGTPAFRVIREAGISISLKSDPNSEDFRDAVKKDKRNLPKTPPKGCLHPVRKEKIGTTFYRDPQVVAFVEERAEGFCELCGSAAPFVRPDGAPYLEVHHIEPLAAGGADTVENAAALCPNCHRECHSGKLPAKNIKHFCGSLRLQGSNLLTSRMCFKRIRMELSTNCPEEVSEGRERTVDSVH